MTGLDEFITLVNEKGRRVYVADRQLDLRSPGGPSTVYVLQLPDGSTAAGGRAGGFGERRIVRLHHFELDRDVCRRLEDIEDDETLDRLDLPYHATAMPIVLPDGSEKLVSGVIDPDFVQSYNRAISQPP